MLYFPVYTLCRHVEGPSSFLDGPSWLLFGSCIEVDAVGYPDEHVTVGDAIVLGHAYADAVASRVDHRLKMARRVDPVVDSALGGVGCAGEHGEVVTEAIGVTGVNSGLAFLQGVMPCVAPVGAGLGGIH